MTSMAFRGIRESIMDSLRIQRGVRHIGKLPTYFDQMLLRVIFTPGLPLSVILGAFFEEGGEEEYGEGK